MRFSAFFESLSPAQMHRGENPPHAYFIPFDRGQDPRRPREDSGRFMTLNGPWAFRYEESVFDLADDFDPMEERLDGVMPVPGVWQMNGVDRIQYLNKRYPIPYDPPRIPAGTPCGLYRRTFFARRQAESRYQLCFEGVDSGMLVWLNGVLIGASQVSHSPAEYDVTDVLTEGENTLCVLVVKWCAGTYFEDQDKFRYTGIFRDVYLLRRDEKHIRDFQVRTPLVDGGAQIRVSAVLSDEALACSAALYAPDGTWLGERQLADGACTFDLSAPKLWTAETPWLYTLILSCGGEVIAHRVGVREISIRDEVVLLNGSPVRFRGVNLHESSALTGAYTPREHILRDLLMMKQHNINAVRTSHYPQPVGFYELCDELGLYVMDEADVETHGVCSIAGNYKLGKKEGFDLIADDPQFGDAILDRVQRMVYRDQNYACVLMYSMGNESGHGVNFDRALKWTKEYDPSRLTHYERASFPPGGRDINRTHLDVYSRMYPPIEDIQAYFREHTVCKPYVLCEYCHAMGNSPGDLEDYFRLFEGEERICGAFVWEWCDHAPRVGEDRDGRPIYRYGGDFGEILHDGNFCADGLVASDRRAHTALLEYKNVLRPIRAVSADLANGRILLRNHLDFLRSDELVEIICEFEDGERTRLEADIPPRGLAEVRIAPHPGQGCTLRMTLKEDTAWAKKGHMLGVEQIAPPACRLASAQRPGEELRMSEFRMSEREQRYIDIWGKDFSYRYDTMTGMFARWNVRNRELLKKPMSINIFRAPTDNDAKTDKAAWLTMQYRYAVTRGSRTACEVMDDRVILTTQISLGAHAVQELGRGMVRWTVHGDGRLEFALDFERSAGAPSFPRVGLRLQLPADYQLLRYFAYGPHESYIDKRQASTLGWYDSALHSEYPHPLKPQESGSHYGAQALIVSDRENAILVRGESFSFSALPYTQEQLSDVMHDDELRAEDACVLCLDAAHRGIGSNSCGPALASGYAVPDRIHWQIAVDPIYEGE